MSAHRIIARRDLLAGGAAGMGALLFAGRLQAQTPTVRIANASGNTNLAMQQLMKTQGYLQEMGLDPTVVNVADGSKIVGSLFGGDMDLSSMSGFSQIFPAIEKGGRMKIIAGAMLLPALALYTGKPDIKTLKDLEGRVVGAGSSGSLVHQLTVAIMMKHGVDYKKVKFVNIGSSGDVFRAVTVGTVDAGLGEVSFIEQQEKYKVRLLPNGNLSVELPEYTYQGAYATERTIKEKRDVLVRTLAAYAKLYRFVHRADSKDAFFKARLEVLKTVGNEEHEAQWNYVQRQKPFAVNLELTPERMRYMQQLNVELGVQKSVMPFEQVADMSLAREAIKLIGGPV